MTFVRHVLWPFLRGRPSQPIAYPQTVSLNPMRHLSDDELVGAQLGTFGGHENCADCRWLAEHR